MARRAQEAGCPVLEVNAGGGLAAPMLQGQLQVHFEACAGILAKHLGPLGVTVACEPGKMFSKNAGVALGEVVTVEDRSPAGDGSAVFAGLTIGWDLAHLRFVYHEYAEIVLCRAADAPRTARYTVTSHINEGPDTYHEDYPLREGDVVAILSVIVRRTGTSTACARSPRSSGSRTACRLDANRPRASNGDDPAGAGAGVTSDRRGRETG